MSRNLTANLSNVMQRNLGRSGLRVSAVGLKDPSAEDLKDFMDVGGSLIDASTCGPALRQVPREELVISTRVGVDMSKPIGLRVDCSRRGLLRDLDERMRSLELDHIDLLNVGWFDSNTPPEEVASTLEWAVTSGRVRYAGVWGYRGWQLAVTPGVISATHEYSLVRRGVEEELLPAAKHLGVGFIADNPVVRSDALVTAAEGLGVSAEAVGVSWILKRADAVLLDSYIAPVALPGAIDRALEDISRVG